MSDVLTLPPGTLLADKFRIERLLGAGAMGAVYAIQHELTRHRRALKLLHADVRSVPDLVRRFLNEASAAGRAGSAHLVETFDAGTLPSGEPYVVMELLDGETLTGLLERESPVDVGRAAELVAQAAEGIEAAHAVGIVHRDLKPDNLFVTTRDGRPFIKILDFGVSKFRTASGAFATQTRAGIVCGSPAYMSPEQIRGQDDVDARTDVFALGVVLYQTLTGKLPFEAPTIEALAIRIVMGEAIALESLRPELPPALLAIVRRAMLADRGQRFPSARALAEALRPFRTDRNVGGVTAPAPTAVRPSDSAIASLVDPLATLAPARTRTGRRLLFGLIGLAAVSIGAAIVRGRRPESVEAAAISAPAGTPAAVAPSVVANSAAPSIPPVKEVAPRPVKIPSHLGAARKQPASFESAPAPPAPPTPSAADSLGLHQDNPFR